MTCIDFNPEFESFDMEEFNQTMEFVNRMPYSYEIEGHQVIIKDKDGNLVMAFGKDWIEKP